MKSNSTEIPVFNSHCEMRKYRLCQTYGFSYRRHRTGIFCLLSCGFITSSNLRFFPAGRAVLSPIHGALAQSQREASQYPSAIGGESGRDKSGQRLRSVHGVQYRSRAHFALRFLLCRHQGRRVILGNHLQRGHKAEQKAAADQIGGRVPIRHSRFFVFLPARFQGDRSQSHSQEPSRFPVLPLLSRCVRSRSREL